MGDASLIGVGAAACALAAVFGFIAFKTNREHRAWCARKVKVDGVVARLAERKIGTLSENADGTSSDPGAAAVPVVRFRAANGIEYEIDASEAPATIGTVVEVAYDPTLPSGARAVNHTPKIGCAVVLLVVGVVLVAIGLGR